MLAGGLNGWVRVLWRWRADGGSPSQPRRWLRLRVNSTKLTSGRFFLGLVALRFCSAERRVRYFLRMLLSVCSREYEVAVLQCFLRQVIGFIARGAMRS